MALRNQESISNLTDISGLTDMSDMTSSTDLTEPRVCLITDCSAPYGPACSDCAEAFRCHEDKKNRAKAAKVVWQRSQQDLAHWKRDWIESQSVETAPMPSTPSIYVQAGTPKSRSSEPKTTIARASGQGSVLESAAPRSLQPRASSRTLRTEKSDSRLSSYSTFSKIEVDRAWIAEYLGKDAAEPEDHTNDVPYPAPQSSQSVQYSRRKRQPECLFCGGPVGDTRDQHVSKCEFAHREQEALERMRRNQPNLSSGWNPPTEVPQFFDWNEVEDRNRTQK